MLLGGQFGVRLRGGCVWLRRSVVVQPIDRVPIGSRHEVPIHISGDLDAGVAHLVTHVGEALAVLDQQRREGVIE